MELQVTKVIAKLDEPSYGKEGNMSKQKNLRPTVQYIITGRAEATRVNKNAIILLAAVNSYPQLLLAIFSHNDRYTGGWKHAIVCYDHRHIIRRGCIVRKI